MTIGQLIEELHTFYGFLFEFQRVADDRGSLVLKSGNLTPVATFCVCNVNDGYSCATDSGWQWGR